MEDFHHKLYMLELENSDIWQIEIVLDEALETEDDDQLKDILRGILEKIRPVSEQAERDRITGEEAGE